MTKKVNFIFYLTLSIFFFLGTREKIPYKVGNKIEGLVLPSLDGTRHAKNCNQSQYGAFSSWFGRFYRRK